MIRKHRVAFGLSLLVPLASLLLVSAIGCSGADTEAPEDSAELTGTLVKYVGRANDGSTTYEYYVKWQGQRIRLRADDAILQKVEPNTQVRVVGRLSQEGHEIAVSDIESDVIEGQLKEALSTSAPKGSVAVFLIKDQTIAGDPYPKTAVADTIFNAPNSTNAYFREASYNQYGLTGTVYGWYSADMTSCNSFQWFQDAMAQAAAQEGFVTNNYRHAIALFERNGEDCFYAFASIGSPDGIGETQSFVHNPNVFVHELGHNLGLHHANSLICLDLRGNVVSYSTNCGHNEYYDPYDAMGFDGYFYHWNTYSKRLQGWLPAANQVRVTAPGTFTIVPQETAASATQGLLIPIAGTSQAYHVEMRKQFGFDNEARFAGAVLVRRVTEPGLGMGTHLLDMSPDTDMANAGLSVGQAFSDPISGIKITLNARTATNATVAVAFNGPKCNDGIKNGSEVGVDCGGVCNACPAGQTCQMHQDCQSFACSSGVCVDSNGGLTGQYYSGTEFSELLMTRVDKAIAFDWANSGPLLIDQFSVRWTGKVVAPQTGTYTFYTETDDGVRLWVNNQLLVDAWFEAVQTNQGSITLQAGQQYDIRMDYFEAFGGARARLLWTGPNIPLDLVPPTQLIPSPTCTAATAIDLGPRTTIKTVPSNACVKVAQYPSWWQWTNGLVTLQSGTGTFPVPATWQDSCTQASNSFTINTSWQSIPIGNHTANCPVVIKLNGNGAPLQLNWW